MRSACMFTIQCLVLALVTVAAAETAHWIQEETLFYGAVNVSEYGLPSLCQCRRCRWGHDLSRAVDWLSLESILTNITISAKFYDEREIIRAIWLQDADPIAGLPSDMERINESNR